jgi:site-specific DNA-methyltransferase (adenine-specific)
MITPFDNTILCGNHLDLLPKLPDECVDMFLTSPPYDNLRTYQGYDFQFEPLARELYRVLKRGGVGVWIVGDATIDGSETLTSCKQKVFFVEQVGFNCLDTMVYCKFPPYSQKSNAVPTYARARLPLPGPGALTPSTGSPARSSGT